MTALLVDSHCHLDRLDLKNYDGQLTAALDDARAQSVGFMLNVCISLEDFPRVLDIARQYENVYASVGVHPNEQDCREPTVDELVQLASHPKVIAIGETGLDYFRSQGELDWQRERFRTHIMAAKQTRKPLIIHNREARDDTLRLLEEEGADSAGGIMHCFVEDWPTAQRALALGFYISISGIVTFNKAVELQEVAKKIPADRLLVETDSPYLAPAPHRGKSNQPAYVRHVAEKIAELRGVHWEEIAEQTTKNFFELFQL